jgi:hypothetical protein
MGVACSLGRGKAWSPSLRDECDRVSTRRAKFIAGGWLAAPGLRHRVLGDCGVAAFHRVSDAYRGSLTCSVKDFEGFCRFPQRHFAVISLGETVRRLEYPSPDSSPPLGQLAFEVAFRHA